MNLTMSNFIAAINSLPNPSHILEKHLPHTYTVAIPKYDLRLIGLDAELVGGTYVQTDTITFRLSMNHYLPQWIPETEITILTEKL